MVKIRSRPYLSITHIKNARLFRDKANRIESIYGDGNRPDVPQQEKVEHKAYCMNSVISSVTFLESFAKEFVDDMHEDQKRVDNGDSRRHRGEIDPSYRQAIVNNTDPSNYLGNVSPPIKYNIILDIIGENEFDKNDDPMEQALLLTKLRNELIHHSPEWLEGGKGKGHTNNEYGFEEDLKGRFELNPLIPKGNAFFPSQCLSYSCAKWALRYSRSLVYHFSGKVGFELHSEIHT